MRDNCHGEFAASAVTLAEVLVGAIRADRGDQVRDALADLQVQPLGLGADAPWELARLRVRTGLKLPDCCLLYAASGQPAAQLATFDARLAAGAAALGIGVVPG
ncbi:MAG: PIN domain-containing protein [Mycobacterium sp.]|nr:PIN domain-containing protein [Mycobacterium sp.]